jgi:hypothetical protein
MELQLVATSDRRKQMKNTHVKRNGGSWTVCEYLQDNDPSGKPRVTVLSVHQSRHEAIDAARVVAADDMYYVDDAPAPVVAVDASAWF